MITKNNLEAVSLQLAKVESLMSAVECLMDSIPVDGNTHERMAKDGLFGVVDALHTQVALTRTELEHLFRATRDVEVAA